MCFFFVSRVTSGPMVKLAGRKSALNTLSAFRTFVRFALVWFCLFPLPLGV